ncbi:MAG: DUF3108 domain-containing protein [Herbaspirillum sp.]
MTETKASPSAGRRRGVMLFLFVALLHLLAIHRGKEFFNTASADIPATSINIVSVPLPEQAASLPVATKPEAPRTRPRLAPVIAPAAASAVTEVLAALPSVSANADGSDAAPQAAPVPALTEEKKQPDSAPGTPYQFNPPPSSDLAYDVHAFFDKLNWYGSSTLTWETDGSRYTVTGAVHVRMFARITFLSFTSSGEINDSGVAPELYTEKKRNRAATNTHFNRERNLVSFSSSTTTYPRVGGEQDRASIIWQLVAIGRGDASRFAPGAVIDMFVAGVRDGEVWRMQIVGQEEIHLSDGAHQAWHIVRQPRPGSYDQRLDIWLDPGRQWYPVRLRFTETSGDYLEMSLSDPDTR